MKRVSILKQPLLSTVNEHLIDYISKMNLDVEISKYLCLNFIREASKNKNHQIFHLEDSVNNQP